MSDAADTASDSGGGATGKPAEGNKSYVVTLCLILTTVVLAVSCAFLLSTVVTQTRLSSITIDGVSLSIRKLAAVGDQWYRTRDRIQKVSQPFNKARNKHIELNVRSTDAKNDLAAKKARLEELLETLHRRVDATEPPIAAVNGKGYADQIGAIQESKPQLHVDHPELDSDVALLVKAYGDYTSAERARDAAAAELQANDQVIKDFSDSNASDTASLNAVFDLIKPGMDAASRAKVDNALYDLFFNDQVTTQIGTSFITMQPDNLTLLLVVLMGVLGSALQLTHAYFVKNQPISFASYWLRISLGAITALVMFIVAKAGVPVITDTSRLGGDAPINPYFVAFLAIISGLLSENALANVQAQGLRFLGQGPAGPDRWARSDLGPTLNTQGLSVATLAGHLGVSEETATKMLSGEKQMDADRQKLVAIYLRDDMRNLFTDIPPPGK